MTTEDKELQANLAEIRLRRRRSNIGLFAGIGAGMMIGSLIPWVRENIDLLSLVLWSAVIGVAVANLGQFKKAGAILTRRDDPVLNYIVGLGLPILFFVTLGWVIRRFF